MPPTSPAPRMTGVTRGSSPILRLPVTKAPGKNIPAEMPMVTKPAPAAPDTATRRAATASRIAAA